MCQNRTDAQKPLSGGWANVQGHATAQLQLSNHSPVSCQLGPLVMKTSRATNNKNERHHAAHNATPAPSVKGDDLSSNRLPARSSQCNSRRSWGPRTSLALAKTTISPPGGERLDLVACRPNPGVS